MKYIESISDEDVANLEMLFGQILVYTVDNEGHKIDKKIGQIETTPPAA
jgi:bisphosphoglycerate-dependent phosphoglycerate mutase